MTYDEFSKLYLAKIKTSQIDDEKFLAKPNESIRKHTDKLIKNAFLLKQLVI